MSDARWREIERVINAGEIHPELINQVREIYVAAGKGIKGRVAVLIEYRQYPDKLRIEAEAALEIVQAED